MEFSNILPIDLSTLRIIWWFLFGLIIFGYFVLQGFDMGVAMLLPFVTKDNIERRVLINTIAPVWEGSQVWLILSIGTIFAAWPLFYSVLFSTFYFSLFSIICALILRPVSFKFRSKIKNALWYKVWDLCIFIGAFIPTFFIGIIIGKFIDGGFSFIFDNTLNINKTEPIIHLFTPYTLAWGFAFLALFIRHGSLYLSLKTPQKIQKKLNIYKHLSGTIVLFLFPSLLYIACSKGYVCHSFLLNLNMASNPLLKAPTIIQQGTWLTNFYKNLGKFNGSLIWFFPLLMILFWGTSVFIKKAKLAFIASSLGIFFLVATLGSLTFPFLMPCSTSYPCSLTIWDSSSSQVTLFIMFIGSIIFIPLILTYTAWVYKVLAGEINEQLIQKDEEEFY